MNFNQVLTSIDQEELDISRKWGWKLMEQTRVSFFFLVQESCGAVLSRCGVFLKQEKR